MFASSEEKEITQWIATKGYFITDLSSLVFQTTARWNIQALTDCNLYIIGRDSYQKITQLVPALHELEKMFITRCFLTLEDRIFSQLSMTAEERYSRFFEENRELFNQIPLQYMASM